jgi:O-antigen ligase
MTVSPPTEVSLRWAPWWVLAFVALWPLTGAAELVLSVGSLVALAVLAIHRFRGGMRLLSRESWALTTVLFASYWLPELLSSPDAVNGRRALRESLLDLRYLPFLWLVAMAVANERGRRLTFGGIAAIVLLWAVDGGVQALTGWSLGGYASADRLSGVFGADNLKLGLVLASLAPFPLAMAGKRFGMVGWLVVAALLGAVVLLAGARASWLTLALVLLVGGFQQFGGKRTLTVLGVGGVMVFALSMAFSDKLQMRVERTGAALNGGSEGLDFALSGRLSIWRTGVDMALANPINGVGVRGFRDAYATYAAKDDPWLVDDEHGTAFHAHQILLEVASETGLIGLLLWLGGAALAWRAWRFASPEARERARAPALALMVTVFPLNTHLAFYSTFWGGLTLLLAALFAGSLLSDRSADATAGPD